MSIFDQHTAEQRFEFMRHVRPEVAARRELGTPVTWAEWQAMHGNSYEWQHLTPLLDDEALLRHTQHCLDNSQFGGAPLTEFGRPCSTYDEVLERSLLPLLMRRLAERAGIELPKPNIDTFEIEDSEDES